MKELIKKLKDKLFTKEMISYLVFGVLTTAVSLVSFRLFDEVLKIHYIASNVISWVIAVTFAYITNKLFVFESKSWEVNLVVKEAAAFASARILSLLFETGFITFAVEIIHMEEFPAKIIASVFVIIINYIASKLFIFKKKK